MFVCARGRGGASARNEPSLCTCVFSLSELLSESFGERPGARKQKEARAVIFLMNYSGLFASSPHSPPLCVFVCTRLVRVLIVCFAKAQ